MKANDLETRMALAKLGPLWAEVARIIAHQVPMLYDPETPEIDFCGYNDLHFIKGLKPEWPNSWGIWGCESDPGLHIYETFNTLEAATKDCRTLRVTLTLHFAGRIDL